MIFLVMKYKISNFFLKKFNHVDVAKLGPANEVN